MNFTRITHIMTVPIAKCNTCQDGGEFLVSIQGQLSVLCSMEYICSPFNKQILLISRKCFHYQLCVSCITLIIPQNDTLPELNRTKMIRLTEKNLIAAGNWALAVLGVFNVY